MWSAGFFGLRTPPVSRLDKIWCGFISTLILPLPTLVPWMAALGRNSGAVRAEVGRQ